MKSVLFTAILLAAGLAHAQRMEVVPPSEIKQKGDAYRQALASWHQVDSGIEAELLKKKPEQDLKRIDQSAERALRAADARKAYYGVLIAQAQEHVRMLEATAGTPMLEGLQSGTQKRLSDLRSQEAMLLEAAEQAKAIEPPEKRLLVQEQVAAQLKQLRELSQNLLRQTELLEETGRLAAPLESAKAELLAHSRDTVRILESEAARAAAEDRLWQEYYESLRGLVRSHAQAKNEAKRDKP